MGSRGASGKAGRMDTDTATPTARAAVTPPTVTPPTDPPPDRAAPAFVGLGATLLMVIVVAARPRPATATD